MFCYDFHNQENFMDNQIIQQSLATVLNICEVIIPFGAFCYAFYKGKGVDFVKAKIGLIDDEDTRKLIGDAFDRVDSLLDTEMSNLEATVKPQLLKDIAEGNLNKDSLKDLGVQAVKAVMAQLPDKSKELLAQEVNDLELYVNKRLEKLLGDAKLNPQSSIQKTVLPEIPQEQLDNDSLRNQLAQAQSQLQQSQAEKDSLFQQVSMITNDKVNIEQQLSQLNNQISDLQNQNQTLASDKQALQAKLDSITQVVQPIVASTTQDVDSANAIPTTVQSADNQTVLQ